jgi:hypothetical protein
MEVDEEAALKHHNDRKEMQRNRKKVNLESH